MEELYKLSDDYTAPVPRTAKDAVLMFKRRTGNWSIAQWDYAPEMLIKCAKGLEGNEMDNFEQWVMNPTGGVGEPNAPMPEHIDPSSCFAGK